MPPPHGHHPEGTGSWGLAPERISSERRPCLLVVAGSQLGVEGEGPLSLP
jgi:hypothetical protein